jgi:hypothetical protein
VTTAAAYTLGEMGEKAREAIPALTRWSWGHPNLQGNGLEALAKIRKKIKQKSK